MVRSVNIVITISYILCEFPVNIKIVNINFLVSLWSFLHSVVNVVVIVPSMSVIMYGLTLNQDVGLGFIAILKLPIQFLS